MPTPTPDDRAFAAEVYRRLLAAYGEPTWRPYYQPMDELVLTFLSQNTSDLNSGRAFEALKAALSHLAGRARCACGGAGRDDPLRRAGAAEGPAHPGCAAPHPGRARCVQPRLPGRSARGRSHALADLLRRHRAQDRVDRAALLLQPARVSRGHRTWAASRGGWGWPGRRIPRKRSRRSGKAWRRRRGSTRCI